MARSKKELEQDKADEEADDEASDAERKREEREELLWNETDAEQRVRRLREGVS